ncbi:ScbR family autoregulator-binding transcription factor [Streptomyces xanthochromogenes]|uniref:ScbR family autoregulator-binding transcription factor n=1 Tax=Streptomyces xanthochromogenes TaxID=67384 RepID=UPI00342A65BE
MATQERAVRTRNALIESAAELFDRDGFEATSLSMISTRAGVSSGALHFHFASKAVLAEAVGRSAAERLDHIVRQRSGGALQELIDATFALSRALDHNAVLRAGFALHDRLTPRGAGEGMRHAWQRWVERVVARAQEEGSLAPGVRPQDAAAAIVAVTAGLETLGGRDARWLAPGTLAGFWDLLLPRLAKDASLGTLVASGSSVG